MSQENQVIFSEFYAYVNSFYSISHHFNPMDSSTTMNTKPCTMNKAMYTSRYSICSLRKKKTDVPNAFGMTFSTIYVRKKLVHLWSDFSFM